MNSFIAMLIALAMFLVPVPDSGNTVFPYNTTTKISDMSTIAGDITAEPGYEIILSSSMDPDQVELSIKASQDDCEILPLSARFEGDSILLRISDSTVYTINADVLSGLFADTAKSEEENSAIFESLRQLFVDLNDVRISGFNPNTIPEVLTGFIAENAESFEETDLSLNEDSVPASKISLTITPLTVRGLMDKLNNAGDAQISRILNDILHAAGEIYGLQFESFAEIPASVDYVLPFSLTVYSDPENEHYAQVWEITDNDGISTRTVSLKKEYVGEMIINRISFSEHSDISDMNGSLEFKSTRIDTESEVRECDLYFSAVSEGIEVLHISGYSTEKRTNDTCNYTADLNLSAADPAIEDMVFHISSTPGDTDGVDIWDLRIDGIPSVGSCFASWKVTSSTDAVSGDFSGMTTLVSNDAFTSTNHLMLLSDILNYLSEATSFSMQAYPEGFAPYLVLNGLLQFDPNNIIENSDLDWTTSGDDADFTDDYPENEDVDSGDNYAPAASTSDAYTDEQYNSDETLEFESFEDAMCVYPGKLPLIHTPEGFNLEVVCVEGSNVSADFSGENDAYIGLYIYGESEAVDPKAGPGEPIFYDNDDGETVYAADVVVNGMEINLYFSDMPKAQAESIMREMGLMH